MGAARRRTGRGAEESTQLLCSAESPRLAQAAGAMIEVGSEWEGRIVKQGKVKWGVLGVASIATKKVIPGMQKGEWSEIEAIASRDLKKAKEAARKLGIRKAYGSYEELLADTEIEAVYNPLPNHLHVPWSIKAAEAGKHVLCEKPLSLTVGEARTLLPVRERCR